MKWFFEKVVTPNVVTSLQTSIDAIPDDELRARMKVERLALRTTIEHFDSFAQIVAEVMCPDTGCPGRPPGDPGVHVKAVVHPEEHTCKYADVWRAGIAGLSAKTFRTD